MVSVCIRSTFRFLSYPVFCVPVWFRCSPFLSRSGRICFSRPLVSITWLGATLSFLSRVHFSSKTSTRCKIPIPCSAFPSRPFVFRLYIMCRCKSGRLSRVIPILFPCPVNYLSRSEWPAFSACFWDFARFSRAIFVFFFFARQFSY